MTEDFPKLFAPFKLAGRTLANRIAAANSPPLDCALAYPLAIVDPHLTTTW